MGPSAIGQPRRNHAEDITNYNKTKDLSVYYKRFQNSDALGASHTLNAPVGIFTLGRCCL